MSEMVERVARAIHEADASNGHCDAETSWRSYIPNARAAIAAMREPTYFMVRRSRDLPPPVTARDNCTWKAGVYTDMIDEALK